MPQTAPCTFCPVLAACPGLPVRPVLAKCPPSAVDGIVVDGSRPRDFKSALIPFPDTPLTSLSIFPAPRGLLPELFELCKSGVPFFAPFDREQRNLQLGARPEHGRRHPIASQRFSHVIITGQSTHSNRGSQRTRQWWPGDGGERTPADVAFFGRRGSPGGIGRLLNHVQQQLGERERERKREEREEREGEEGEEAGDSF